MNKHAAGRPGRKVVIAGAGPAGSGLAIRLAERGLDVTLIEKAAFPREKLCGEFISPECLRHFGELGVLDRMIGAGGTRILETRFFELGGRSIAVPSSMFGSGAIALSRAAMDNILLERARECGVDIMAETAVKALAMEDGRIAAVRTSGLGNRRSEVPGDLFIDATGRSAVLTRLAEKALGAAPAGAVGSASLLGFKAHMSGARPAAGTCEIFSFPSGYGGAVEVEGGMTNLCFLVKAAAAKRFGNDPEALMHRLVKRNRQACQTLEGARAAGEWLAVSVSRWGVRPRPVFPNLLAVGDAGAFIDPFTGSGILTALESAALFARTFEEHTVENVSAAFHSELRRNFRRRMLTSAMIRPAALSHRVGSLAVAGLGLFASPLEFLARSTRPRTLGNKNLWAP